MAELAGRRQEETPRLSGAQGAVGLADGPPHSYMDFSPMTIAAAVPLTPIWCPCM